VGIVSLYSPGWDFIRFHIYIYGLRTNVLSFWEKERGRRGRLYPVGGVDVAAFLRIRRTFLFTL
jgi:hypothetical protein